MQQSFIPNKKQFIHLLICFMIPPLYKCRGWFIYCISQQHLVSLILQWKEISQDQLMDYKLKCVFETPRGTNLNVSLEFFIII